MNDETRTNSQGREVSGIDGYHTQDPGWIAHVRLRPQGASPSVGTSSGSGSAPSHPADALEASAIEALRRQVIALQRISSLGVLAGGVFHELNNALTPILNYAKLGLRNPDPAYRERALTQIVEAAQRAATITRGMLGLSRPGQRQPPRADRPDAAGRGSRPARQERPGAAPGAAGREGDRKLRTRGSTRPRSSRCCSTC